jgi:hypothetical protein
MGWAAPSLPSSAHADETDESVLQLKTRIPFRVNAQAQRFARTGLPDQVI